MTSICLVTTDAANVDVGTDTAIVLPTKSKQTWAQKLRLHECFDAFNITAGESIVLYSDVRSREGGGQDVWNARIRNPILVEYTGNRRNCNVLFDRLVAQQHKLGFVDERTSRASAMVHELVAATLRKLADEAVADFVHASIVEALDNECKDTWNQMCRYDAGYHYCDEPDNREPRDWWFFI